RAGIALAPEERRSQGVMLQQSVGFNINVATLTKLRSLPGLPFVSAAKAKRQADRLIADLGIKTSGAGAKIAGLSGGNQQKALIARWLNAGVKLLILDEPSRGVDVGAREEIHDAIRGLARSGVAILVISSDVEELTLLADRETPHDRRGHSRSEKRRPTPQIRVAAHRVDLAFALWRHPRSFIDGGVLLDQRARH